MRVGLAAKGDAARTAVMDATTLQGALHGLELAVGRRRLGLQRRRLVDCTRGGLHSKLHAVIIVERFPMRFFPSATEISDQAGTLALLDIL